MESHGEIGELVTLTQWMEVDRLGGRTGEPENHRVYVPKWSQGAYQDSSGLLSRIPQLVGKLSLICIREQHDPRETLVTLPRELCGDTKQGMDRLEPIMKVWWPFRWRLERSGVDK